MPCAQRNKIELAIGTRIEQKEHKLSRKVAMKIARDHIREYPKYYTDKKHGLLIMEKKLKKAGKVFYRTSKNKGHTHTWKYRGKRTSSNAGHTHPIDLRRGVAGKGRTDHIHKLLNTIA